jgi:hypothetical protein
LPTPARSAQSKRVVFVGETALRYLERLAVAMPFSIDVMADARQHRPSASVRQE